MTEIPHRSRQCPRQWSWLGLFVCLVLLIVSGAANAHGSVGAGSSAISPVLSQHVAISAADPVRAADEHSCPIGSGHRQHQVCASSGICHAMAMAESIALPLNAAEASPDAPVAAAIAGSNVAPLFHPPKSPIRF